MGDTVVSRKTNIPFLPNKHSAKTDQGQLERDRILWTDSACPCPSERLSAILQPILQSSSCLSQKTTLSLSEAGLQSHRLQVIPQVMEIQEAALDRDTTTLFSFQILALGEKRQQKVSV